MSSKLRPECGDAPRGSVCPTNGSAYYIIYNTVRAEPGLIAGRLHEGARHCAIGSFFARYPDVALETKLIDEVALVNDSVTGTPKQRRTAVLRWLKWKLRELKMPGFDRAKGGV